MYFRVNQKLIFMIKASIKHKHERKAKVFGETNQRYIKGATKL